jgi:hypothetical protein
MAVTEATGSRQLTCDSTGPLRGGPCDLFRVSKMQGTAVRNVVLAGRA